jgi:hypothetical protein
MPRPIYTAAALLAFVGSNLLSCQVGNQFAAQRMQLIRLHLISNTQPSTLSLAFHPHHPIDAVYTHIPAPIYIN